MAVKIKIQNNIVNLASLGKTFTESVLYKSMAVPARRLAAGMKFLAPQDTGALRNSIDIKVNAYPATGKAVAIVGPKKKYRFKGRKPSKYAHLVEFGHIAVKPTKGKTIRKGTAQKITKVKAQPFVRPAVLAMRTWGASSLAGEVEKNLKITLSTRKGMTRSP